MVLSTGFQLVFTVDNSTYAQGEPFMLRRTSLILARLSGGPLEHTGVMQGMSGSPVYIDGKLVGALSLKFGVFVKEPLAGVTPIEDILSNCPSTLV